MKKVSVIIPCYNCAEYVRYCMESLFRQTIGLENMEIILINDASTDQTIMELAKYEARYPEQIILIPLVENVKQGGARNIGLTYATGEYIVFLDSDDFLQDEALEHLYHAAKEQDADIVEYLGRHFQTDTRDQISREIYTDIPNKLVVLETIDDRKQFILGGESSLGCIYKFYRGDFLREHQFRFAEGVAFEEPAFTYPMRFFEKRHYFLRERLYCCYSNPKSTVHYLTLQPERKLDNLNSTLEALRQITRFKEVYDYENEVEYFFLNTYFVLSLFMMLARHFEIDVETLRKMQYTVRELFPDYANNPYLQQPECEIDRKVLRYVDMDINEDTIKAVNDELKKIHSGIKIKDEV